jgi:hypothetical protein
VFNVDTWAAREEGARRCHELATRLMSRLFAARTTTIKRERVTSKTPKQYPPAIAVALALATVSLLVAIATRSTMMPEVTADASKMTVEVIR